MFPIPWNRAFRKKDGTLVNMEDAMSEGGSTGHVEITSYVTNLTGLNPNVNDVSTKAPTSNSRLIGVISNLAYHNKISSGNSIISTVGLCFDQFRGQNPNCFYCYVNSNLNDAKFDLIWWVPADT